MPYEALYELIIIGAGPAGIAMAYEAKSRGIDAHKILMLEKAPEHSWSIRRFYPEEKLVTANYKGADAACEGPLCLADSSKEETLQLLDKALDESNVRCVFDCEVNEIMELKKGYYLVKTNQREDFVAKVVAVAVGVLGKPNKPDYKIPHDVKEKVHYDLNAPNLNSGCLMVVGGGDSASEYAQVLAGRKVRTSLCYRRDHFFRMTNENKSKLEALIDSGQVQALLNCDIEALEACEQRIRVHFKDGKEPVDVDGLVYALGGSSPKDFLKKIGIVFTHEGLDISESFEANSKKGLFFVGDISAGFSGGSINVAFNSSHRALNEICDYHLGCKI